ncbi:hypothetical protein NRIC_12980 [Enterococcus florum]|uniref:DUF2969 domain-containing protein n=1 Tax=Enterococcus florum TaxID=2480627 RepID=A0A4P5P683_9ENTE|nr:DUF2969 domain-containing protein [Enterococcus florum]GCF93407.1 hypothetical protein NRIC_12980 [Enterococcus florum]
MAKKNKDIQVQVQEAAKLINGKKTEVTQLVIGKKVIGEIIAEGKGFRVWAGDTQLGTVKTLDDGIEAVIRNWNLHD